MEPEPATDVFASYTGAVTSATTDNDDARRAQQERIAELVREREAEHGPVDPAVLAEVRALADAWSE